MIKRVDRYIFKEMAVPMIIGTVIIALLFMANELIAIFKGFEISNLPPLAIMQIVLYRMPEWLSLTLPSGTAIGVALALSRLSRESEITAMRAAGLQVWRILLPVLVAGLLVSALNFFVVEKLIPPASQQYRNVTNQASVLSAAPRFKSNVMIQIDRYMVSLGTIQRLDEGTLLLQDIIIVERPRPGETILYMADEGVYDAGIWTINQPKIYLLNGAELVTVDTPEDVVINERVRLSDMFIRPATTEETAADLKKAIADRKRFKADTSQLEVAYYVKFSLPASCLIFALTAAAFAVGLSRSGPFTGLIVSLGMVMVYYNFYIISTEIIGRYGWLPPILSAWLPNILFLCVALAFIRRAE